MMKNMVMAKMKIVEMSLVIIVKMFWKKLVITLWNMKMLLLKLVMVLWEAATRVGKNNFTPEIKQAILNIP